MQHVSYIVAAAGDVAAHHLFFLGLLVGVNLGLVVCGFCAAAADCELPHAGPGRPASGRVPLSWKSDRGDAATWSMTRVSVGTPVGAKRWSSPEPDGARCWQSSDNARNLDSVGRGRAVAVTALKLARSPRPSDEDQILDFGAAHPIAIAKRQGLHHR